MTKITTQQSDAAILSTFNEMKEGVEYILTAKALSETNAVRKKYSYSEFKRDSYKFCRKGNKLFCNNAVVLDFDKTTEGFALALSFVVADEDDVAAVAFTFALQSGEIEELNKEDALDGTLLVKDGRTYRLTLEKQ